jgi:uncharacterized RDD family membrane protein YckC
LTALRGEAHDGFASLNLSRVQPCHTTPTICDTLAQPNQGSFVCEETNMADGGRGQFDPAVDIKPHAYDPYSHPEYFEGVLARRMIAFLIDLLIIMVPIALICVFIFFFGIVTFGIGWLLFALVVPGSAMWALIYCGSTIGGPASATIGMRTADIELRTWYGEPGYFLLGLVHAIAFWITISVLTPLVLVVGLLNERQQLLHDLLLGTIVINNERRAAMLRQAAAAGGEYGSDQNGL